MFTPSIFQSAIFNDIAEGEGNSMIVAVAGSGKTTTLINGFEYLPNNLSTLFVAFNKSIADELSNRIPKDKGIECSTLHSYGFKQIIRAYRTKLDKNKVQNIIKDKFPSIPREAIYPIQKAVSICKAYIGNEEDLNIASVLEYTSKHSIQYQDNAFTYSDFLSCILAILDLCRKQTAIIDFDDMIWIPVINNLRLNRFDRIFVDEAQDLNLTQIELVCRAIKEGGRICVVGDPRQGIYAFRGAANGAMDLMQERLDAKVFPLSITYRCPKSVVRLASKYVEDFSSSEDAIEGSVTNGSVSEMLESTIEGDLIVSRANLPLTKLAYKFIAREKRARIKGKDFGDQLVAIAKKYQKGIKKGESDSSMQGFLAFLINWEFSQIEIIRGKYDAWEKVAESVTDKADCMRVIASKCNSVYEVIASIESLFSDLDDSNSITLSTTHKAKGLEYKNVYCLEDTYLKREGIEEENLFYVAITRAKENLILVKGNIKLDDGEKY